MKIAWSVLKSAGVPIGPTSPKTCRLDEGALRAVLSDLRAKMSTLSTPEREAMLAWLRALRLGWPQAFERVTGAHGAGILRQLEQVHIDPNRYLKLRRIARENLSGHF